jgi:predicted enzyme related to lactoylglutathione lyase
MAIVERYAEGTPSWVDLATSHPEPARTFDGEVFGWGFDIGGPESRGSTIATAEAAGGVVAVPGTDSPFGRYAVLSDPPGAVFTVMAVPPES